MTYRTLKNLRDSKTSKIEDLSQVKSKKPAFKKKALYRDWCSNINTKHVFYSCVEGRTPSKRITSDNPVHIVYGIVADYDAPVKWDTFQANLGTACNSSPLPTWSSRTQSDYLRLVWEFENPIPVDPSMYEAFVLAIDKLIKASSLFAGFDKSSFRPNQYFELGVDWQQHGNSLPDSIVFAAIAKAAESKPPESAETCIPIDVVSK